MPGTTASGLTFRRGLVVEILPLPTISGTRIVSQPLPSGEVDASTSQSSGAADTASTNEAIATTATQASGAADDALAAVAETISGAQASGAADAITAIQETAAIAALQTSGATDAASSFVAEVLSATQASGAADASPMQSAEALSGTQVSGAGAAATSGSTQAIGGSQTSGATGAGSCFTALSLAGTQASGATTATTCASAVGLAGESTAGADCTITIWQALAIGGSQTSGAAGSCNFPTIGLPPIDPIRMVCTARPTSLLCATARATGIISITARPPAMGIDIEKWQRDWDIGDECEFGCTTRNAREQPYVYADPSALTATVRCKATQTETVHTWPGGTITRDKLGHFHIDVVFTSAGAWHVRWKAQGAIVGAEEGDVLVRSSAFANP